MVLLTACGGDENEYEGMVKVTYQLEGGTYQNSTEPVTHYYAFEAGTENKIMSPTDLSNKKIERPGYTLEGWYTKKNGDGASATYADKWDFDTGRVTDKGVTLYAKWKKDISYTFNLYYKDASGADVLLEADIAVDEGQPVTSAFVSLAKGTMIAKGLTPLDTWTDAEGNAWNMATDVHPGGETDTSIRLYAGYITGKYNVVRTAKELKAAIGGNIYLMNDIDFAGGEFGGFGDYTGTFIGNGYTIRNFKLTYPIDRNAVKPDTALEPDGSNLLRISLFGEVKGATIRDVTFENYTTEVSFGMLFGSTKVLVAPFAMKLENTTLENVSVTATYTVGKTPAGFDTADILVKADAVAYYIPAEDTSSVTNVTVSLTPAAAE